MKCDTGCRVLLVCKIHERKCDVEMVNKSVELIKESAEHEGGGRGLGDFVEIVKVCVICSS